MSKLNVRINQKIDTTEAWEASSIILNPGEIGIEKKTVTAEDGTTSIAHLVKVGNGSDTWSNLPYIQAIAADVEDWAKAATKPEYKAEEITGLEDFINGEVQDTNTQYEFSIVEGTGEEAGNNVIVVSKKDIGDADFVEYARIPVPFTDVSNKAEKTETVSSIINAANDGTLTITKADGTSSDLKVAGVVTVPTWDPEARKLTLPYTTAQGVAESVDVNLGKDAVVTSGVYNAETKEIELTLSVDGDNDGNPDVIKIPAASLVDVYTGGENGAVKVEVSADNVITAQIKLSQDKDKIQALTFGDDGGLLVEATEFGEATVTDPGMMSAEDKAKLDAIAEGAQVNVLEAVKVNGTALEIAEDKSVNLVNATDAAAGLMSAEDKARLDAIADNAEVNVLEGVTVNGEAVAIDANKIANITIPEATTTKAGLMSAADKAALEGGVVHAVEAGDASIEIGGDVTNPTVAVKISEADGNALELVDDGLVVKIPEVEVPEYTVVKDETAEAGFISTYHLQKDGVNVGASINIPKDFLVKSANLEEVTVTDAPYTGAEIGDKYIDFTVNVKDGELEAEDHIYLPVNELVDVYTAGNGIEISTANVVSAKVVAENGLSVDADGIKLGLASADAAGAMSADHFNKLEGIEEGAQANVIEKVSVAGTEVVAANKEVNITAIPVNILENVEGDTLVFNCGSATEVI